MEPLNIGLAYILTPIENYLVFIISTSKRKKLEVDRVPNWNGKFKWHERSIRKMLSNLKYKGDALLQKSYTVDFLTKKRGENNGEVPQYYVEGSHPAIIDKEMWEAMQLEMERRRAFADKYNISRLCHR